MELSNSERIETKKHDFGEIIFDFQIFETFRNLDIDFSTNLNKCFWTVVNISEAILLSCQTFDLL